MRTFLAIFLCLSVGNLPLARGDCSWPLQTFEIVDTDVNKQIFNFTFDGDFAFKSWVVTYVEGGLTNALTYFQHDEQDKTFFVQTTETFGNLNEDAYTDGKTTLSINIVITLTCDAKDLDSILYVSIKNTNKNAPEFPKSSYTYSLPMPIMPKTDLSVYGDSITAKDIDFSTTEITFSVDSDDFSISSSKVVNKEFRVVFSANNILRYTESQRFTLTAKDSGTPAMQTSVEIILNVDPTTSLDSPSFSSVYYTYNYTGGDTPALIPTSTDIVIQSDKADEAKYTLTGDNAEYFTVSFTNTTKTFSIGLDSGTTLPEKVPDQIVLSLIYTTDVNINAVILITVVKDESVPEFSSNYYDGTYDITNNKISWTEAIQVSVGSTVELSGDKSSLFKVDPTSFEITPVSTLSTSDFDENGNLFLTATATTTGGEARAAVIITLLTTSELKFDNAYYYGTYTGVVSLDDAIGFSDLTDFTEIHIAVDSAYSDNFKIELDSIWKVTVIKGLNSTTLNDNTELAIPITATKGESGKAQAILILRLPAKVEINFKNSFYTATYVKGSESNLDTVDLDDAIIIDGADASKLSVIPEDYEDNFELTYNDTSLSYEIKVIKNLDPSIQATQLMITIAATESDTSATANTVLILKLPNEPTSLNFENKYYAAAYVIESSTTATVQFSGEAIKVTSSEAAIDFKFEGYDENFLMVYDDASSSYNINVQKNLDLSVIHKNTELIITITASITDATDTTVLMLSLPSNSINFENQQYAGEYSKISESEASVQLDKDIGLTAENSLVVQFSFEGYEDNFELRLNSTTSAYNVFVKDPLSDDILSSSQYLVITIMASTNDVASLSASTVLLLRLPLDKSSVPAFENEHYVATYQQSTSSSERDTIEIDPVIKIKSADFAETSLSIEGYDDNFVGTCDAITLDCSITVHNNLNTSVLILNTELLLTLTASNKDGSKTGKTVLLVKLPSLSSTFSFTKQYYSAIYTIETTDTDKAIVTLNDTILFDGAVSTELGIVTDEYSSQFNFEFDTKWNLIVANNLDSEILSSHTELIISITATKTGLADYAKATLIIKLPDKMTMAFLKPQYTGEYVIDASEKASVKLTEGTEIETTDTTVEITLDSYFDNFEVKLVDLKWTINIKKDLDPSVFIENKQLRLLMTVTKANVKYGESALIINLPDPSFSQGFYTAIYSEDDGASITSDDIGMVNVEPADIQVNLSQYNEYIYTDLVDSKWVLKLSAPLPTEVTQNYEILLTTLEAIRKSDNTQLTTSTLLIKLPDIISDDVPKFTKLAFSGDYKNSSDTSSVELSTYIGFTNSDTVTVSSVTIEEGAPYSTNFKTVQRTDSTYSIDVTTNLAEEVLATVTSIVLTLVATTKEGNKGYAALLINLPKITRETSVNFQDEEILYSGTYENGTFESPSITLKTDTTDDSLIEIEITNDLGVDNKYFKSIYKDKVLSVNVDTLPDDILKKYAVIPLKLAITDKSTGDTVHAVLNVNIEGYDTKESSVNFKDGEILYAGTYENGTFKSPTITLVTDITDDSLIGVEITNDLEVDNKYFKSTYKDKVVSVNVDTLPDDILKKYAVIPLKLAITDKSTGDTVHAVLNVNIEGYDTRESSVNFKDGEILYAGTYENGTFKSPTITLVTDITDDSLIGVEITNDLEVDNKYFKSTYKDKVVSVNVDTLPDDILKKYAVVPLKLAITDKSTGDTVHAVLNVNINYKSDDNGGGGDDDDDSKNDDHTGLLVAVIILAILLLAVIIATILLWYFKIRNAKYIKMEEEEVEKPTEKTSNFTKNLNRQSSTSVPSNSAIRRPTGLPVGYIRPDSPTEETSSDFEAIPTPVLVAEHEKKVVFDDHVQNIDEYDVVLDETSDNFQNVADRRPTQFVFANPMEAVLDSPTDSRRESSDYIGFDPEKKKSVIFDDNVERMHIDVPDDENNELSDEEDADDHDEKEDDLEKFKAELKVKLEERRIN